MKLIKGFLSELDVLNISLLHINCAKFGFYKHGEQKTGYKTANVLDSVFTQQIITRAMRVMNASQNAPMKDALLLYYPERSMIPKHTDRCSLFGAVHTRCNILIASPQKGGVLKVNNEQWDLFPGDAFVFKPDQEEHEVSTIDSGHRLVLSIGCMVAS